MCRITTSKRMVCRVWPSSSESSSGFSTGNWISRLNYKHKLWCHIAGHNTCWTVVLRASHSILCRKDSRNSILGSVSRFSISASAMAKGKLSEVHPLAWHCKKLWVKSLISSKFLIGKFSGRRGGTKITLAAVAPSLHGPFRRFHLDELGS
jgi:hypothetical protein